MFIEKRLIVPFSLLLLIVGFLALLAVVGMTVRLGDRANQHFDEVISTRDVRVSAVEIRSAVQSAESSQRGLLLTGNEIYLSPYDAAKTSANRQLDNLKRILEPDIQFEAVLQRLTIVLAEKFQEMDRTIALKDARKDNDALAIINTNRGKALMDEVNLFVSGIVRSMDNRLTLGVAEQRANAVSLRWASVVSAGLIVLVVGAVAATLLTYTKELTRTQAKVTALNLSLGQYRRLHQRVSGGRARSAEVRRWFRPDTRLSECPKSKIGGVARYAGGDRVHSKIGCEAGQSAQRRSQNFPRGRAGVACGSHRSPETRIFELRGHSTSTVRGGRRSRR